MPPFSCFWDKHFLCFFLAISCYYNRQFLSILSLSLSLSLPGLIFFSSFLLPSYVTWPSRFLRIHTSIRRERERELLTCSLYLHLPEKVIPLFAITIIVVWLPLNTNFFSLAYVNSQHFPMKTIPTLKKVREREREKNGKKEN